MRTGTQHGGGSGGRAATVAGVPSRLTLTLDDPEHRYRRVRLAAPKGLAAPTLDYAHGDGAWRLDIPDPGVTRLEYELELEDADGHTETACDPGNPLHAPGAFGEKSVVLLDGYSPPAWLGAERTEGLQAPLAIRSRALRRRVHGRLWSPAGTDDAEPLPLLVANDGPEYDELAGLTAYAAAMIAGGRLPPHRIALLEPAHRDEWYSASRAYARALCTEIVPELTSTVATAGRPAAAGASLGALAMLHAQRRHPGVLGALFLQSGSYFAPRFDAHEDRFPRYRRVVAFTGQALRAGRHEDPVPAALTCGTREENIENNRLMAKALALQGYPVRLYEVADLHNFTAWRDALDPCLTELLQEAWA